jgi:hypothetical protein
MNVLTPGMLTTALSTMPRREVNDFRDAMVFVIAMLLFRREGRFVASISWPIVSVPNPTPRFPQRSSIVP